ncbi:chromate efflux transporter [Paracoccus sp. S3-43]|uniref:chromate efflux transporter n=1 Tax=Paracoccus sp. S3-43 TaxID=3030011 RepID=UPI0023B17F77|nr:chromate efflux transporter [Paracoccus sp. S3-43]WEF23952.1 chromate efflux transporter [Paracoccus sp. S3-43]
MPARSTPIQVFLVFLKLGLTSFGGPVAHLGYFRDEFVVRRQWLSDAAYGDLVALCQFLPGPASSQVGFALGLMRAGWAGAAAAFLGFTLPSALLLAGLALTGLGLGGGEAAAGVIHGLKIVAVAIVAQAVWGMARSLCPDRTRAGIALAAVLVLILLPGSVGMMGAIAAGAAAGLVLCRAPDAPAPAAFATRVSRRTGLAALIVFAILLAVLPLLAPWSQGFALAESFFRAGSLVFGGGHVVLPLLEAGTVATGWIGPDAFLAGYGLAQAVPGPLFTFAAWLGALMAVPPNGIAGAAIALLALFLPGFLILTAALPFWDRLRRQPGAQAAMAGANAAVVGILGLALYDPVFVSAIGGRADFALALTCFLALIVWKAPSWAVVLLAAGAGAAMTLAG